MSRTVPFPTRIQPKEVGLELWMARVLERADRVRQGWGADDVHDLRVALRRCRTMADALSEVNPAAGWRRLKRLSRELFHALGALRDAQVERVWIKQLGAAGDPLRRRLLRQLAIEEAGLRKSAERALKRFDRKLWKKLSHKLAPKSSFAPMGSVVFERLALARLNAAQELYRQARRRRSAIAWHRLRIGLKGFRYVVENFLPQRHSAWAADLKQVQDLLGDVHDLDVLRKRTRREAPHFDAAAGDHWMAKIASERTARLQESLKITSGGTSLWGVWRSGFSQAEALVLTAPRVRQTA